MPTYQRAHIHTVDDVKAVANHAGSKFFTPGAMAFFNSRLLLGVIALDGPETREGSRFLFITSERFEDAPQLYNVRLMTLTSVRDNRPAVDISTVGEHMTYTSANEARQFMVDYYDAHN